MAVTARGLGGVLLALVVGVGAGVGAAYAMRPDPESSGTARPVPALPSVPTDEPYAPDIDFPALGKIDSFDTYRIGNTIQTWQYAVPQGWVAFAVSNKGDIFIPSEKVSRYDEVRFRPAGEPPAGGYSLRVKAIDNHKAPADEIIDRIAGFERAYGDDYEVLSSDKTDGTVAFSFRTKDDYFRYNFFRWFTAPGATEATLEMSIAGRAVDEEGLRTLFQQFANRARPVED